MILLLVVNGEADQKRMGKEEVQDIEQQLKEMKR